MPRFPEPAREAVSLAIVSEVAESKNVDPVALDPLYETVDPDAVDALLEREFEGTIEFEYADCPVRVRGDGAISVGDSGTDLDDGDPIPGRSTPDE